MENQKNNFYSESHLQINKNKENFQYAKFIIYNLNTEIELFYNTIWFLTSPCFIKSRQFAEIETKGIRLLEKLSNIFSNTAHNISVPAHFNKPGERLIKSSKVDPPLIFKFLYISSAHLMR